MDKLLFIINPVAGAGKAKGLEKIIVEEMDKHRIAYEIVFTRSPKEGIQIAENAKNETVIAVGGDGTVNEVAKGLINRGYGIMGIIPGGTGNDMSKSLGFSKDPLEAIDLIIQRKVKEIDIGVINGNKFLNIASAGFDAEVVENTNAIKVKYKGRIAYILGVLQTLINYKRKNVIIEIDKIKYKRNLVLLAVGNGKYYGGGMMILPDAILDDGFLHICLARDAKNLTLLRLFPYIFKGKHIKLKKYVELFKAKEVNILSDTELTINFDGEILNHIKEVEFKISKEKLKVICT